MDRTIVYPGSIPLDSDLLSINRNTMVALGYLMQAAFGNNLVADGLICSPTVPASMSVRVGSGSMAQMSVVDSNPYGSLGTASGSQVMKMGINQLPQLFDLTAPANSTQSINYLIEASLQESDQGSVVLSYYNAANPSQPFSGPANSGNTQPTARVQYVQLRLKAGIPSATGTQQTPSAEPGWAGLYVITVSYGQTSVVAQNIQPLPQAPFINWKLPDLRPGFGAGVKTYQSNGVFLVPAGVSRVEVELWGAGSGSYGSTGSVSSGGGSGGGYARKRIDGLTPGQTIDVTVGTGGAAGRANGIAAAAGGASGFGTFVNATGGGLNYLASPSAPQFGATPPGVGVNGDVNLTGSAGQAGYLNQGGMGGGAAMGGSQNSGTTGVIGTSPGGGASGAGTGPSSATSFDGAMGAAGLVVVRW